MRIFGAKDARQSAGSDVGGLQEVLTAVEGALNELTPERNDYRLIGHRAQGEALEVLVRPTDVIVTYELALVINPKIGVAKRVAG